MSGLLTVCAALLVAMSIASAQQPKRPQVALTLEDCVKMALDKNIALQQTRLFNDDAKSDITRSLSIYDPNLSITTQGSYSKSPGGDFVQIADSAGNVTYVPERTVAKSNRQSLTARIRRKMWWGAEFSGAISSSRTHRESGALYHNSVTVDMTQPLMRGFGRLPTESDIRVSRLNLEESNQRLRERTITTMVEVEEAYWSLVKTREAAAVQMLRLESAQELLVQTRIRVSAGAKARTEILSAEVGVANARVDSISSATAVRGAEDLLKQRTNLVDNAELWDAAVIPLDDPTLGSAQPDLDNLIASALANRPEYQRHLLAHRRLEIAVAMSKDRLKPQLNAVVSLNLDDSGDDIGEGTDELVTAQFQNWSGSLIFSMPLGNRDAKTRLANSRVEIRRSELTRQALEQQIFAEVRTAVRKFVSAQRTIEAASEAVRLAETQLAAEKERLRLGLATNYEVLQIEQDLARERNTHLDAVIDYQNALTDIAKTTGSILADRGIIIE